MNKNSIIAILGALVALLAITLIVQEIRTGGDGPGTDEGPITSITNSPSESQPGVPDKPKKDRGNPHDTGSDGGNTGPLPPPPPPTPTNSLPVKIERELPPVKPSDVARLPRIDEPQEIATLLEVTGKGTLALGVAGDVSFYYLMKTVATSKIEKKEEFESGKIKVTEIRSFSEATEAIKVSDVNLRVDLSTLPVEAIANTGYIIGGLVSLFAPAEGAAIATTVADYRLTVESLDGTDAKPVFDMCKKFGIDVQRIISEPVEGYLKGLLDDVHHHVNAVTGKSYRFIYWTDKDGEPIRVRYENVDKSPITVEEQNVLNYVNLFIDCHILPDRNCRPGDTWPINPTSIGAMFGADAGDTCSGEITVRRGNDLSDGNWSLSVDPATITFYSKDHRPVGNVKLRGGKGIGDSRRAILRELQIDGTGKLRKKESDTYLWFYEFITKTEGDCQFRSTISPRRDD